MIRVHPQAEGFAVEAESDPEGTLFVTDEEWYNFLELVKRGIYDDLKEPIPNAPDSNHPNFSN